MHPPAYQLADPLLRVLSHGVGMGVRVGEDKLAVITCLERCSQEISHLREQGGRGHSVQQQPPPR